MMKCKRGDVALLLFPDSSLRTAKRRPVVIVQANNLETGIPQVVVAMISSNPARAGHRSRVSISVSTPEGQRSGLKSDSIIMTDNLATVREDLIDRVIGSLSDMVAVDAALRHTLGL